MRQTSLIVDPPDGRFPALTDYGKKLQAEMKSSYKPGQNRIRCRGRFLCLGPLHHARQPGFDGAAQLQQLQPQREISRLRGDPARNGPRGPRHSHYAARRSLPGEIKQYLGESRGHWEGNTLVVETTNFNGLVGFTSAGVPGSPGPLQPEDDKLRIVERFTRVAGNSIEYNMKVEDPTVLATGSFTIAYPMYLDNKYEMFEYACHEGNTAIRNYIETSRYERAHPKEKK